jgi:hypothetical protein
MSDMVQFPQYFTLHSIEHVQKNSHHKEDISRYWMTLGNGEDTRN